MKESEAIQWIKELKGSEEMLEFYYADSFIKACDLAIKALEEVQQYRQIGTVDECRKAVGKQTAKKPIPIDYEKYVDIIDNAKFLRGAFWCPNCRHVVYSGSFCKDCGQKLDWSDEE